MARKDDIEEAVTNEINRRLIRTIRTVCVTATLAVAGFLYNAGVYLYDKWYAFKASINLFIEMTKRGGQ